MPDSRCVGETRCYNLMFPGDTLHAVNAYSRTLCTVV